MTRKKTDLDKTIFSASLSLLLAVTLPLLFWPQASYDALNSIKIAIEDSFGVIYIWTASAVLAFVLWLAFSKYGQIKLGNVASSFSTYSWVAMLFCAGVATGILYWGTIEWAYYYDVPPFGLAPRSNEAIEWAATYGMFHWGITGWAYYVLPTIAIGYAYYVKKIPFMRISSSCESLIGDYSNRWPGKIMDIFFIVGLLGSSGTSLALGTPMIAASMEELFGIENTFFFKVAVILCCTIIFSVSVYLGLEKGIKRLSNINATLALIMLLFVLLAGPTVFILKMTTNSIGLMAQNFIRMNTWADPLTNSRFVEDWSIFYWAWWVAVGPFMGIFVARISRGRSIKQVILGSLFFGSLGCTLFYGVFGNYALYLELNDLLPITELVGAGNAPMAIAKIVGSLPAGQIVLFLFAAISLVFMATTFDSISYTLASSASKELEVNEEPERWHRLFWAFALALLPIALMLVSGLDALKTAVLISAPPLVVVYVMMAWSLLKSFQGYPPETIMKDSELIEKS